MRAQFEESPLGPIHGGLNPRELESLDLCPEEVLDFSASINPLGTGPGIKAALRRLSPDAYPDRSCLKLRRALGSHLGIEPEAILVGNGSTELIHLIARAFLSPGETAVIFTPTFGEYAAACRLGLLKRYKICVRDCGSFGLPEHIRVGVRDIEDSRRLVRALKLATATISENHE